MNGEPIMCRICFDNGGPFICPCDCIGSGAYVHNVCLLRWYETEPDRGRHCTVCKAELSIRMEEKSVVYGGPVLWRNYIYFDYPVQMALGALEMYVQLFCSLMWRYNDLQIYKLYVGVQLFHHLVIGRYIFFTGYVRNKRAYYAQWCSRDALILLALYGFVLGGTYNTSYLGNLTLKLLVVQLWKAHVGFVERVNITAKPLEFVDKNVPR